MLFSVLYKIKNNSENVDYYFLQLRSIFLPEVELDDDTNGGIFTS